MINRVIFRESPHDVTTLPIIVGGAGIIGLWQALTLAEAGHDVRLLEAGSTPFTDSASRYGGAMIAPDCEAEAAPAIVRDLGRTALARWQSVYPALVVRGTLVVAAARDRPELVRFARMTEAHQHVDAAAVATLEPELGQRFPAGLFFAGEAHMSAPDALAALLDSVRGLGVDVQFGTPLPLTVAAGTTVIDCRGIHARPALPDLRGVRGERIVVRAPHITLTRPVRLLHPRHALYVVPWRDGYYMIGATVIESDDAGPATVRSALELLGAAYALHPAFGEAEIIDIGAGIRPAFSDNVPRIVVRDESPGGGRRILVNGAYRHGFLLAPILADAVAAIVAGEPGALRHPLAAA